MFILYNWVLLSICFAYAKHKLIYGQALGYVDTETNRWFYPFILFLLTNL